MAPFHGPLLTPLTDLHVEEVYMPLLEAIFTEAEETLSHDHSRPEQRGIY